MAYHACTVTANVVTRQKGTYFPTAAAAWSATKAQRSKGSPQRRCQLLFGCRDTAATETQIFYHQAALRRCARPQQRYLEET